MAAIWNIKFSFLLPLLKLELKQSFPRRERVRLLLEKSILGMEAQDLVQKASSLAVLLDRRWFSLSCTGYSSEKDLFHPGWCSPYMTVLGYSVQK
jgi:hypothetical protein